MVYLQNIIQTQRGSHKMANPAGDESAHIFGPIYHLKGHALKNFTACVHLACLSWAKIFLTLTLLICILSLSACGEEENSNNSLQEARESFARKEYLDAEKLYERYLRYVPESPDRWEAWDRVAYIAMNIRRDEPLTADILEAMALEYGDEPERYQDVIRRLADIYESNHRWSRAKSAWERLLLTPNLPAALKGEAHLHLAQIYQLRLDYLSAMKHLETCLQSEVDPEIEARALYRLSTVYADQGESKQAEEKLFQLTTMQTAPESIKVQGLFMLADLMEEKGNYREALELFSSIESTYPNQEAVKIRIEGLEGKVKK